MNKKLQHIPRLISQPVHGNPHDMISRFNSRQAHTRSMTAFGALDQTSQLFLLSSYLCIVESYDKFVQHIKTWTEVRSKIGASTPVEYLLLRLPTLAIGSFKRSASSSSQPLVLTCIIEAIIIQIRERISEMMKPVHACNGIIKIPNSLAGEQSEKGGDELCGLARITLQTIKAQEVFTILSKIDNLPTADICFYPADTDFCVDTTDKRLLFRLKRLEIDVRCPFVNSFRVTKQKLDLSIVIADHS